MKQKLIDSSILLFYIAPILGFGLPRDYYLKFALAVILSVPGIIYVLKSKDFQKISYIGNWKKSLMFELSWIVPVLIILLTLKFGFTDIHIFNASQSTRFKAQLNPVVFYIVYAILSSPIQELAFRGLLPMHLKNIFKNDTAQILISSLVFGLAHFWYPLNWIIPGTFVLGLILAIDRLKYNSLVGPSIGHALVGVIAFNLNLI
ncbi:MAG: type II CAAX endopeptidase family protein [bacterium]